MITGSAGVLFCLQKYLELMRRTKRAKVEGELDQKFIKLEFAIKKNVALLDKKYNVNDASIDYFSNSDSE